MGTTMSLLTVYAHSFPRMQKYLLMKKIYIFQELIS